MSQQAFPQDIKVSVIIPAYNASDFISKALTSVLEQTYKNFELIIIDDCSRDDTFKIINDFAAKDDRIKVYRNEKNSGVAFTRNFGVLMATSDWIAFLDSDDKWRGDKLEKQIALLKNNPDASLIFTGSSFINEGGKGSSYILRVPEKITFRQLLKQNLISCSSVLVKKEHLLKYKMERDDMHEDFAVWLQILRNEKYAYGIDEPLLIYRISSGSKSGNKIKAAGMTYSVYRYIGLNFLTSLYNMFFYTLRNLKKYRAIKASWEK